MTRSLLLAPALAATLLAATAHAQPKVVIYRCTAADGAVTVQNDRPCPKGSRQEKKLIETASAPPAKPAAPTARVGAAREAIVAGTRPTTPAAPSPAPAPPSPATAAGAPAAGLGSTPYSGPATQTVPPSTQGVPAPATSTAPPVAATDRAPPPALFECRTYDNTRYLSEVAQPAPRCAPLQTTGVGGTAAPAGEACQMVSDTCEAVPAASLCERWRQRVRDLQSAISFGRADGNGDTSADLDRAGTVVRDSTCAL